MKALLYLDDSMAQSEALDGLGRVLAKDVKFNLLYVIKPYLEMNMIEHDLARGRALLSEAKSRLIQQGCQVDKTECAIGIPQEKICKWAAEWKVKEIIIYRRNVEGPALLSINSLIESKAASQKDKNLG